MFQEHKEGIGSMHPSPEKSPDIPGTKQEGEASEMHEGVHEGVVGKIIDAIRGASPNAIIFVSGLGPHEYTESMAALADEKGVTLVDRNKGETVGAVRTEMTGRMFHHPNEKIVADMPLLLKNILFAAPGTSDSENAQHLMERSHYDPARVLLEWIEKSKEESKGDAGASPETRFAKAFEEIRTFAGNSDRPIVLALPAHSPLILAYLTFAKYKNLLPQSIRNMCSEYPLGSDAVATLRLERNKAPRVFFGQREVGEFVG